jgi:WD40 repeat protein
VCKTPVLFNAFKAHAEGTTSTAYSPNGEILATGGYDCAVRLWSGITGQEIQQLEGHRRGHVAFSPDGSLLVSAGLHKDATVYETATWRVRKTLEETASTWGVAFSPDGTRLAVISPAPPLMLWDTQTWQVVKAVEIGAGYLYSVAFAPTGDRLAISSPPKGLVRIWRADLTEELHSFSAHQAFTYCAVFSPDGTMLATGGADHRVHLWNTADWKVCQTLEHTDSVLSVAFSPDQRLLASGSLDGSLTLWALQ